MKKNQTLMAGAVLVVLILVYWLTQTGTVDTKSIDPDMLKISAEEVSSVEVNLPESQLTFSRSAEEWMLEDYPVDTSRMQSFLEQVTQLDADRVITKNPEKYTKYEVDEQGTALVFKDASGKQLLNLVIGKQGANYQETFVKLADKDPVYAVLTNLLRYKSMKTGDFWDKTVTSLSVEELTDVALSGEYNYVLHREGPVWTYNGEQVDFEKVENMLKPLENLKASNFVDEISDDKSLYQTMALVLESGEKVELKFYLKDDNASTLLLDASTKSKNFEYPKSTLNRYKKTFEDLKPAPVE